MLVLTRKLDEAIRIGDDIKITILRVKGNTVRIGIEAPRDVRVVRDELEVHRPASAAGHIAERPQSVTLTAAPAQSPAASSSEQPRSATPPADFQLLSCAELLAAEDDAVVATVVDSPQPSTSRLFIGKMRISSGNGSSSGAHDSGDQAAPLRAFLRSDRTLQAVG